MIVGTHKVLVPSWSPLSGVQRWQNENGFTVLQMHYSAFAGRTKEWATEQSKGYPGGIEGRAWRREQELDWSAWAGQLVYPQFALATHVISMRPEQVPESWPRFRFIDPGYNAPCAVLWGAIDGDGVRYCYDILYVRKTEVPEICSRMKAKTGRQKIEFTLIDPEAYKRTQVGRTIAEMYIENGIMVDQATSNKAAGILAVAEALRVRDDGQSNLRISEHCKELIWEIGNYRYKDREEGDPEKEKPIDVDDHLMACLYFFVMGVPDKYRRARHDPYRALRGRDEFMTVKQAAQAQVRWNMASRRIEELFDDDF